jgi:hypothetical protein
MANKIYAFDDYGIKHETMSKDQIENAISTGEIKKDVFEGSIEYDGETVSYNYAGVKPDDAIILKLLECGISPKDNPLTPIEIQTYLGMENFSIHFYYSETEIYATNAKNGYLGFEKVGIGTCKLYPDGKYQLGYFMKSSKKINDVLVMGQKEFDDTPKQEETVYIVDDVEYTQNVIVNCYYDGSSLSLGDNELGKLINNSYDRLLLKMNYTDTGDVKYEFLKLKQYTNDSRYDTYDFENSQHYIEISIIQETLDSINLFGQVVLKATYADYADYAIKNPNGSYSKFTHDSNGVLKVGDNHIISKKKLLWSGEVDIGATDFIDIFTSNDSLKDKKLEVWVQDKGLNYMFEPITLKVTVPYSSSELFKKRYVNTDDLDNGFINSFELTLRYNSSDNSFQGMYYQNQWNITNKTNSISGVNCYVTEIYEIIE